MYPHPKLEEMQHSIVMSFFNTLSKMSGSSIMKVPWPILLVPNSIASLALLQQFYSSQAWMVTGILYCLAKISP
jgi:hypothetical protein